MQAEMEKLPRAFYERDPVAVARDILGCYLIHRCGEIDRVGQIVEVEAYLGPQDLAAHSAKGLTPRTRVMFGPAGHAYIYLIYGIYWCMNVVTEPEGYASAVLLRALEPVQNVIGRTQGPGLLCRALEIDKRLNGRDLTCEDFFLARGPETELGAVVTRPRIGVAYAGEWADKELRFYLKKSRFVSRR